jgi:hypothetical protein
VAVALQTFRHRANHGAEIAVRHSPAAMTWPNTIDDASGTCAMHAAIAQQRSQCLKFCAQWTQGFRFCSCSRAMFPAGSPIRELTMSIFAYRKHLRFLTPIQRRRWWDQKKRLKPRVQISGAYVPPSITREFTYVKVG